MKKVIITLLALLLVFAAGCKEQESDASSDTVNYKPHQNLVVREMPYKSNWIKNGLSEAGLSNVSVDKKIEGRFTEKSEEFPRYVYLLGEEYKSGKSSRIYDSHLAVETDSKVFLINLCNEDTGSYGQDCIYACDVDGDGLDEIVLQQTVGMTGGAGSYLSRVFKVEEDKINEIFGSSGAYLYDTGFTGVPKDDFKLEMRNKFTGYVIVLDMSAKEEYVGVYFDESGKAIKHKDSIMCDSFWDFFPEDVDGDGIYELVCRQYVSLYGHSDFIGIAKSALKYNPSSEKFEVIRAEFMEKYKE